tara:strand:- start:336 stop:563 length:228 start_codon:yes stop_codon:yes gene_type:complete
MQKIVNALSLISFGFVVLATGAGTYSFLWLKNPENIENVKQKVIDDVMAGMKIPSMPGATGGAIPKSSGFAMPKF